MNNAFQITTAYRIEQLEKRLASLESSLSLLGQRVTSLDKVTDRLAKQEPVIPKAERPVIKVDEAFLDLSRKKEKLAQRWAVWEELDRIGTRPSEIAKAFGCHHSTVLSAKKNGFKSGWITRAESRRIQA